MTRTRLLAVLAALWMVAGCSPSDGGSAEESAPATAAPIASASSTPTPATSSFAEVPEAPQFSSGLADVAETDQVQIRVTPHMFRKGDPDFHYEGVEACPGADLTDATGILVVDLTARTDTYRQIRELVLTFTADEQTIGTATPTASWREAMVQRGSRGLSAAVQPGPGLSLGECEAVDGALGVGLPLRIDPTEASTRFRTFVVVEDWFDHATDQALPPGLTLAVGLDLFDDAGTDVIGQHLSTHRIALDSGETVRCPADGTC